MTIAIGTVLWKGDFAQAGTLMLEGNADAALEHDSNVNLATDNVRSSLQYSTRLTAKVIWHQDEFAWYATPGVQLLRYRDAPLFDRNNALFDSVAIWDADRSTYSVQFNGVQDSTLTSEAGTTGATQVNKRHRSGIVTLNATRMVTERTTVLVQGSDMLSRYQDAASAGLFNYDYMSAALSGQYAMNERLKVTASGNYGKLHVQQQRALDKTTLSMTLGLQSALNDRSDVSVSVGPSTVRSQTTQNGVVYSAKYHWRHELASVSTELTRSVTPTGFGALSRQDSLDLNWYQPLGQRWFSSVTLSGLHNRYVQQSVTAVCDLAVTIQGSDTCFFGHNEPVSIPIDIKYGVLTGALGWHMTPTLDMRLSASVATQDVNTQSGRADRRHIALTISWNGLEHALP